VGDRCEFIYDLKDSSMTSCAGEHKSQNLGEPITERSDFRSSTTSNRNDPRRTRAHSGGTGRPPDCTFDHVIALHGFERARRSQPGATSYFDPDSDAVSPFPGSA
jgi:hypothetical protein